MSQHPFYAATYNGRDCHHYTAADWLLAQQRFTREQCLAALELDDLLETLRVALERRLRKLEMGAACP